MKGWRGVLRSPRQPGELPGAPDSLGTSLATQRRRGVGSVLFAYFNLPAKSRATLVFPLVSRSLSSPPLCAIFSATPRPPPLCRSRFRLLAPDTEAPSDPRVWHTRINPRGCLLSGSSYTLRYLPPFSPEPPGCRESCLVNFRIHVNVPRPPYPLCPPT